jgi:Rieske Fe-S protein
MEQEKSYTRRSFLNKVWAVLGTLAVAQMVVLIVSFFRPRAPRKSASGTDAVVIAGHVDSFETGSVSAFVQGGFYLARLDDGGFLAMSRTCTHLSCTVPWVSGENKFICPCHSSEFDIRGNVISPPAPRALDVYPVAIENNVVKVDTGKLVKRSGSVPGHIAYPKQT